MTPNEVLGVRSGASPAEVRRAYRSYVLVHHPDRGGRRESFELGEAAYRSLTESAPPMTPLNVTFHRRTRGWKNVLVQIANHSKRLKERM